MGKLTSHSTVSDINGRRAQTIIRMVKGKYTLEQIGKVLGGLSRERVRQLSREICTRHGEEVFKKNENGKLYTITEVAKIVDRGYSFIYKLCVLEKIPIKIRGKKKHFLTEDGLKIAGFIEMPPLFSCTYSMTVCDNKLSSVRAKEESNRRSAGGTEFKMTFSAAMLFA